jgi:hypothetical protein
MSCVYCGTDDCGTVDPGDGTINRTTKCRNAEYLNHSFAIYASVKLKKYDDGFLADYEHSAEIPPQALVLMEREGRVARVISKEAMSIGSDKVTVEVDGHRTVLWNKFLERA